jgi:hypothetical protein
MEVLKQLIQSQEEYEDALRVEIEYNECCSTKRRKEASEVVTSKT